MHEDASTGRGSLVRSYRSNTSLRRSRSMSSAAAPAASPSPLGSELEPDTVELQVAFSSSSNSGETIS